MESIKKLLNLLTLSEKNRAFLLIILILVMGFFDVLGVASILPFIAVISNPELVETNTVLTYLYQLSNFLGVESTEQFLIALGAGSFLLLVTSLSFKTLTIYFQNRFIFMCEYNIGKRLITNYLTQPYTWFLNKHSADLGKSILSEVNQVVAQSIIPMIFIVSQSVVSLGMLTLLIIADPILALNIALVFGLSYGGIFFFIKNFLSRLGSERLQANKERFLSVLEAFNATKEIKVGGLESVYIKRFSKAAKVFAHNQVIASVGAQFPRYFIEGIAFGGLIILILFLREGSDNFANIIPILTLYAFAGYRLIPSLQQLYSCFSQLRFSRKALDALNNDMVNLNSSNYKENDTSVLMPFNKSIVLKNVYFNYPNYKKTTLQNINLTIPAFKKVGIVGATGSGKTTIVDVILGLLDPSQGTLSVDEQPILHANKRSWQKGIGYVPQQIYLADTSVAANIALGEDAENIDYKLVEQATKIANFHDFVINELPQSYNTIIGERGVKLSGGQRQRIGIARALYHNPQVLILDEATSALDNLTEKAVMEAINNLGNKITIILIAHRLSTVKSCDTIFLMDKGKLKAQGTYEDLIHIDENFKNMASS